MIFYLFFIIIILICWGVRETSKFRISERRRIEMAKENGDLTWDIGTRQTKTRKLSRNGYIKNNILIINFIFRCRPNPFLGAHYRPNKTLSLKTEESETHIFSVSCRQPTLPQTNAATPFPHVSNFSLLPITIFSSF